MSSTLLPPDKHRVTKAGFIGNGNPAFFCPRLTPKNAKSLKIKDFKKLARLLPYLWHNNNKNV
ncbi:MAG: hypothetical protein E6Q69_14840 [Aquipseudomonas alcaligenes]|uniref:Uncharacterized protein n=1 Tax=Aquipseudomonas alcaligenes TaxID=43263 RepID=A0A5C7VY03_AQUAC|nr:MAG: hypothetical protein E6Q69_14840 [Pseudomonas alcaligenes]